jgi:hypothetical protein
MAIVAISPWSIVLRKVGRAGLPAVALAKEGRQKGLLMDGGRSHTSI